ncbi:hypothetical protein [Chitinophaga sp. sic0106]|uniref:hypothetical protein n=1 Tax=Chitinophaga sp. sic0106 TaxID=2854785 RepID=UPI001C47B21F|nr:hypothetical protein [Chitinophaga sp. sic0106]MBV7532818.1 hypothetical protein [Chitinophaga sp. sic0106]
MLTKALDVVKDLLVLLFLHFRAVFKKLNRAKHGIPLRYLASDFLGVLHSCAMFTVLTMLAFFIFNVLPQGRDVLLIIVEEIAVQHRVGSLFWLLGGVTAWSVVSEFGTRYSIYVTDNSGRSLPEERVEWRKVVQETVAQLFLLLPFFIVFLGFLRNYLQDTTLTTSQKNWGFGIPVACLYLVMNLVVRSYFSDTEVEQKIDRHKATSKRLNKEANLAADAKLAKTIARPQKPDGIFSFFQLNEQEQTWCSKLIGIYNTYVFAIRKASNFQPTINEPLERFTDQFSKLESYNEQLHFLQREDHMPDNTRIPADFIPLKFTQDPDKPDGQFRWVFKIPLDFYDDLHRQIKWVTIICLSVFLIVCFLPLNMYPLIGSPGLVIIAITCWLGMYLGLLYLDYAWSRDRQVSLRFLLFVLLVVSSFINNDHQVRYNDTGRIDNRPSLATHFDRWFEDYKKDSLHTRYYFRWIQDTPVAKFRHPVIFVCAEGGALRTAAFAAQTLSFLQDNFVREKDSFIYRKAMEMDDSARKKGQPADNLARYFQRKVEREEVGKDFKKAVYAYSGVSGGALGLSFFNAIAYMTPGFKRREDSLSILTRTFFTQDYLSPVIGKMFYGDFINLFLPFHIQYFDRAIALEESWEHGFMETVTSSSTDIFSEDFLSLYPQSHKYPAMFINTTEVESGLPCWLTNVRPDSSMALWQRRDLLAKKIKGGINYSTMVNFSSRFPLFSPAANLRQNSNMKLHYVDGGYAENTGSGTMLEVLQALKRKSTYFKRDEVVPFVIVLKFSDEKADNFENINLGNEIMEVLLGINNARSGRSTMALTQLERYTERDLKGRFIALSLEKTGSQVPLNWVLSGTSIQNLQSDIEEKWKNRMVNDLNQFFLLNNECVLMADTARAAACGISRK